MRIVKRIGNSHLEEMELIYDFICHFDVHRLLYAINGKHLDEDEILSLTDDINEYKAKLERQKHYLFKFCKTFPKEFASEDNKLPDASEKVSWRMRSGVAGVKKVFKTFCKVSQKKLPGGVDERQACEVSLINVKNYCLDLFGLSSYPECVKELFKTMFEFYESLDNCLVEARRCVKEVATIKGDAKRCLDILIKSCEKSKEQQAHIIEAMMDDPELKKAVMANKSLLGDEENSVLRDYKRSTNTMEQFAQKYYKNCSPKDVSRIGLYNACSETGDDPNLSLARIVFGDDLEKNRKINLVIEHFDELLPTKCKRGKIPAMSLYFFYEWCGSPTIVESFLKYFNKYYKEHRGQWDTIGNSAITGARGKYVKDKEKKYEKERQAMLKKIEALIASNTVKKENAS